MCSRAFRLAHLTITLIVIRCLQDRQFEVRMSNVSRLPPSPKTVHVERDISVSQQVELDSAVTAIIASERPHMENPGGESLKYL
jgi:hypothetical protein